MEQGGLFEAELLEVAVFIVRGTSLPAAEEDAEPFESQGANGGVMAQAAAAEHPVVSFRPERPLARMVGVLMECLPQELGAGATAADRAGLATADLHGRDAAQLLKILGVGVSFAVGAERRGQARQQRGTGAWEGPKQFGFRMPSQFRRQLMIVLGNSRIESQKESCQFHHLKAGRLHDGPVSDERDSGSNPGHARIERLVVGQAMVLGQHPLQGSWRRPPQFGMGWELDEELQKPFVLQITTPEQFQGQRKELLEPLTELVFVGRPLVDEPATILRQEPQQAGRLVIRFPGPKLAVVGLNKQAYETGIERVSLLPLGYNASR